MFVVTTQKRIIQITVLVILSAICFVSFIGYEHYQNTIVKPSQLMDRLNLVAAGETQLAKADFDAGSVMSAAKIIITDELGAALASTNLPEGAEATVYLIEQASQFLSDEALFQQWLEEWMQKTYSAAGDDVIDETLSTKKRLLRYADQCLLLTSEKHHWRLVSIGTCESLSDQQ